MSRYSCTNQRYEFAPLRLEIIEKLPAGTTLYYVARSLSEMDPIPFAEDPELFPRQEEIRSYQLKEDLAYIVGLPEDNPRRGLCWECQPEEVFCYDANLEQEIPVPCAWYQEPYFYLCPLRGMFD